MIKNKRILITDDNVYFDKQINKLNISTDNIFKKIGHYEVAMLTSKDISFLRDKQLLEDSLHILFKKKIDYSFINFVIQIIILLILLGKK